MNIYYAEYQRYADKWCVSKIDECDYNLAPMNEVVQLWANVEVYGVAVHASSKYEIKLNDGYWYCAKLPVIPTDREGL